MGIILTMETVDLIISAPWIVPVIPSNTVLTAHCVVIHQGQIVDVIPYALAKQRYQPLNEQHFEKHCLTPGLINNHTHAAMSLLRGLADDLPLMTWLNDHIWPAEAKWVSDSFVEAGSELAIAEMIRGGTTCFNDMYFFPDATARIVDQSGLRANLGMVVIEFPSAWAENAAEYLRKGEQLHDKYSRHTRLTTAYAPHAPYTVSDESLTAIMTNAEELDVPIHMHIHETAGEITQSVEQYGVRPLERLKDLALLSPRLTAVHMTQLTDDEISWCSDMGVHIAHCPSSNLKLASGYSPIAKLSQSGVNVTLGTDGAASNNSLDMFAEVNKAALLAKAVSNDASAIPAHEALEMATINAAKSLGLEEYIGSLETGKSADLIAIDLSDIESQPCYDVISQLVYATGRDKVTDVWVEGKTLLKDRQLTTLNQHKIIETAHNLADRIRQST